MGEGKAEFACRDGGEKRALLLLAGAAAEQAAAEHHGGEVGLQRQGAPERFHDDHGFDRTAAEAAMLLREGQGQEAEFGILRPQIPAPALLGLAVLLAALEVVAVGQQPIHAVLQEPLLLGEVEIHASCPLK
jgi:hypothetical protein